LKAINYETKDSEKLKYNQLNTPSNIVSTKYFITNYIDTRIIRKFNDIDSFNIYVCVQGKGTIVTNMNEENISFGEIILVSAICKEVVLQGKSMMVLEIYIKYSLL